MRVSGHAECEADDVRQHRRKAEGARHPGHDCRSAARRLIDPRDTGRRLRRQPGKGAGQQAAVRMDRAGRRINRITRNTPRNAAPNTWAAQHRGRAGGHGPGRGRAERRRARPQRSFPASAGSRLGSGARPPGKEVEHDPDSEKDRGEQPHHGSLLRQRVTPAASIEKPTRNETRRFRKARSANTAAPPARGYFVTSSA